MSDIRFYHPPTETNDYTPLAAVRICGHHTELLMLAGDRATINKMENQHALKRWEEPEQT
jgi:hypothetical protein